MIDARKILPWMGQWNRERHASRFCTDPMRPGWISNGHFAILIGDKAARKYVGGWRRGIGLLVDELAAATTNATPMTEVATKRKPSYLGSFMLCACRKKPCIRCSGDGTVGIREPGHRVWKTPDGIEAFVDFDYAAFLDGCVVTLAGKEPIDPLVGRMSGTVVCCLMPMRTPT